MTDWNSFLAMQGALKEAENNISLSNDWQETTYLIFLQEQGLLAIM